MSELFIVNYCHPDCEPLKSVTRLPEKDAYAAAQELSDRHKGTAFVRFADFCNYYPRRIATEQWLHKHFLALGGKPETEHPLYFVLQGNDFLKNWFDNGTVSALPLAAIKSEHISFMFGDSAAQADQLKKQNLFLTDELQAHIEQSGGIDSFLENIREQYSYIEVQLWSDEYLPHIITNQI